MKKVTLKVLAAFSMVALVLVACNKDEAISPDNITETQDFAPVIKYTSNAIPGSYIVVFKKDTGKSLINKPWAEAQVSMRDISATKMLAIKAEPNNIHQVYSKTLGGFAATLTEPQLDKLRLDPDVAYIEQDQTVSLAMGGPPGGGGGDGGSDTQETPWGISRVNGGVSGASGTAWVIDSGIDLDHPDLNVDVARSVSYVRGDADDQNGHGTHVAGTIAAIDNEIGVIGVAAGATVVAVRVLDRRGSGSNSGVIAGVWEVEYLLRLMLQLLQHLLVADLHWLLVIQARTPRVHRQLEQMEITYIPLHL
jgi:subtilisin family serine protease